MKKSLLIFLAATLSLAACSEKEDIQEIVCQTTDTFITTYESEMRANGESGNVGAIEGFYMVTGFDKDAECLLTEETYASFEMLSGAPLQFVKDYRGPDEMGNHVGPDGAYHITSGSVYLFNYAPWEFPDGTPSEYDLYQFLPVAAPGEGEYVFALKFYQPGSGEYFITRPYYLRLWTEGVFVRSEIHLADKSTNQLTNNL